MKRRSTLFLIVLILALVFGTLILSASAASQGTAPKAAAKTDKPKCLDCHGPFDKIIAATADYKTPSGETVSPHRYIPHAEKTDIPDCTECHTPHPIPLESKKQAVKPDNIDFCYTSCHHAHNLQPCKNCH